MLSCVQNFFNWSFLLISFTIYVVYLYYIWTLFENDRHYSHLSELEREMSFRSEMAFYYYYFKVFTEDLFADGSIRRWWNILREDVFTDHQSQAPNVVNAHYSYNIVPEILIGTSYRLIHWLMEQFNIFQYSRQCWLINRGDSNLLPVESCEGFGDPSYFYVYITFSWNAIVPVLLFMISYILSNESIHSAFITVGLFAFNQSICSRIQWTPPLRESFGYPLYLMGYLVLCNSLKHGKLTNPILTIGLVVFQLSCWQFSSFLLLIQCTLLFMIICFCKPMGIYAHTLSVATKGYETLCSQYLQINMIAIILHYIIQCGNTFVLKSFYASFVISAMINMKLFSHSKNKSSMLIMIWKAIVMAMMTISIKLLISWCLDHNRQDDEQHIWTLALAIYDPSTYANFHTRLYTCANEFNYMSSSEWNKLTYETWIIPSAIIGSIIHRFLRPQKLSIQLLTDYSLILCLVFAFLAAFIMRLKLLFIPQLCILAGLICSRKDQTTSIGYRLISLRLIIFILLVSIILKPGMENIRHDLSINGEYSNGPLEEMIEFIRQPNGPIKSNDIFAGE